MATKTKPSRAKAARRSSPKHPPVEMYTDQRVAEFLLSNTVDAADYARAVRLVRKMGLEPEQIDHDKPIGVR
jgi:hypothetical protein